MGKWGVLGRNGKNGNWSMWSCNELRVGRGNWVLRDLVGSLGMDKLLGNRNERMELPRAGDWKNGLHHLLLGDRS